MTKFGQGFKKNTFFSHFLGSEKHATSWEEALPKRKPLVSKKVLKRLSLGIEQDKFS